MPLALRETTEIVSSRDMIAIADPVREGFHVEIESDVYAIPDRATMFSVGCEYATMGTDQTKNLIKVKAFISMDGQKWDFLMSFTATGGPEFLKDGVTRHTDPQITGKLPEGKRRLVKVVYIPLENLKTAIAVRCF